MVYNSFFKSTVLFSILFMVACGKSMRPTTTPPMKEEPKGRQISLKAKNDKKDIITGADNFDAYLPLLEGKRVGVVTNQTGIVRYIEDRPETRNITLNTNPEGMMSVVDFLLDNKVDVQKIYAPEHGFRGTADAGELIKDGKDTKTGLPIISLYGDNKKPKPEQLDGIDILVFDLQDVGARFYTYISSLHYIMEACAEKNLPLVIFDRPNPNGAIVDGPILEKQHNSFIGMHSIPVLHGMTIGEYGKMINGEKWLKDSIQCELTVIPCLNYKRGMFYHLPVKPSPNLPNDKAINLYASLCFFEGTNVSLGRGTDKQFQIYGSPDLPDTGFSFTPMPNEGSKEPPQKGKLCFGEDLSNAPKVKKLELKWLLKAYDETKDKSVFFTSFFTKLAGTETLRRQIESGMDEDDIRESWKDGISDFKKMRKKYLIYR